MPGAGFALNFWTVVSSPRGGICWERLHLGFALIKGRVARVVDVADEGSGVGRRCVVCMAHGERAEASVYFDVKVWHACFVLMVTPHTGVAIVPVDTRKGTYVRVGAVSVYSIFNPGKEGDVGDRPAFVQRDATLSASRYPDETVITLL
ncbi:hypothetical protein BDW02DRAFT_583814 [Decorospora gaudefroyi]|uniref:Uncharacterized protein n=1 Tax=Decorospora gaudefroyi TaxID=184978 RepID=A0A6A5JX29_9PLEO|nr:hypothetical protein BDW02DRAFT_583814 [Decorospora gaudefroyi]